MSLLVTFYLTGGKGKLIMKFTKFLFSHFLFLSVGTFGRIDVVQNMGVRSEVFQG